MRMFSGSLVLLLATGVTAYAQSAGEAVVGNMGVVTPSREFVDALHRLTVKHGALLICDEVMTGFRVARGGHPGHPAQGSTTSCPIAARRSRISCRWVSAPPLDADGEASVRPERLGGIGRTPYAL